MSRCGEEDVRGIVETDRSISLEPFIRAASNLVDRVEACASRRGVSLTTGQLRDIAAWLAAHFYVHRDPQYTSKSTGSASGSFKTLDYLETAQALDTSGCLRSVMKGNRAGVVWLGKPPSTQVDYRDRD